MKNLYFSLLPDAEKAKYKTSWALFPYLRMREPSCIPTVSVLENTDT